MRIRLIGAAALVLAAAPAWAQELPREVTGPRKVTRAMIRCTDLPITAPPSKKITIKGVHAIEDRAMSMDGQLMIGRTPDDGLAVGQRYSVHRMYEHIPAPFPKPGEGFGDLLNIAVITITAIDEFNALVEIDSACAPIQRGDFIAPLVEPVLPTTAAPMAPPDFSDRGKVLFGNNNRLVFGDGDTFSIDRGTLHGVVPGARFAIYRDSQNGMPLVYLGDVVVLVPDEQTSKVALVRGVEAIYTGDVVVPRRQP